MNLSILISNFEPLYLVEIRLRVWLGLVKLLVILITLNVGLSKSEDWSCDEFNFDCPQYISDCMGLEATDSSKS